MTSSGDHPLSVVILTMSFHPSPMGGSEIQAARLAKELQKEGVEVSVLTLAQKGQVKYDDFEGIPVFRIRLFLSPFFYGVGKKARNTQVTINYQRNDPKNFQISGRKSPIGLLNYLIFFLNALYYLKRSRFTVIYVPTIEWLAYVGVMLGRRLDKPVVVKDSTMNGLTSILRYPLGGHMRKAICESAYFIAMTSAIRKAITMAGVPENRINDIPNGIFLRPASIRHPNPNKFVFVGNLTQQPAKGIDILLKAWKIVILELPYAELSIIGDGNIEQYKTIAEDLGISKHVHFMGKLANFENHLMESMAFILPSRREGMSNALLEAMALGVTCIATDISGNQDLIIHGVNGLLVPTEREEAIADAVKYVFLNQSKAIAMGIEARKTIEAGFTLSSVSERYKKLFQSLS